MARIEYEEDPRTGERVVRATGQSPEAAAIHGQCECGTFVRLPRSGNAVECSECGAIYRAAPAAPQEGR